MSTLAVTVACVTCIVKTGKPPSVFFTADVCPSYKAGAPSTKTPSHRNAALHGDATSRGGGPDQAPQAIVYHGNCFVAYGNFCSRESPEKRVYAAHVG